MKNKKYKKLIRIAHLRTSMFVLLAAFFFFPSIPKIASEGNNLFLVKMQGEEIGYVADMADVDACCIEARRRLANEAEQMVFADAQVTFEGQSRLFGVISSKQKLTDRIYEVLKQNIRQTRKKAYTLKINEFTVNMESSDDVRSLLQAALNKYDTKQEYKVSLVLDPTRELNVLTTQIQTTKEVKEQEEKEERGNFEAGVATLLTEAAEDMEVTTERGFEDFELGLSDISYGDEIEVVEAYLMDTEITPLQEAVSIVTKEQEKNKIYEVVSGDTLSGIALKTEISVEKIIELNEMLEDENSTIRVGDELIITVPEPVLSVERIEDIYYEEYYDAPIEYIYNDNWYTTESAVRQEPSAGHRKVIAAVAYRNDAVTNREILKEELSIAAVPKVIEVGTKTPPTYIKPISGGRFTSGFKRRWGRMHKGVDWAVPIGTAVMASSGGTVVRAGWASGYGYVVYINHADGRQTRYGHLSKVLVKSGQIVKQGQKIALSGNTGRSTGPHVHFEILIGGSQVNPLNYMN